VEGARDEVKSNSTANDASGGEIFTGSRIPIKLPTQHSRQSNFETALLRPNTDIALSKQPTDRKHLALIDVRKSQEPNTSQLSEQSRYFMEQNYKSNFSMERPRMSSPVRHSNQRVSRSSSGTSLVNMMQQSYERSQFEKRQTLKGDGLESFERRKYSRLSNEDALSHFRRANRLVVCIKKNKAKKDSRNVNAMPGNPAEDLSRSKVRQGQNKTHEHLR
jgi:hypothetical protein